MLHFFSSKFHFCRCFHSKGGYAYIYYGSLIPSVHITISPYSNRCGLSWLGSVHFVIKFPHAIDNFAQQSRHFNPTCFTKRYHLNHTKASVQNINSEWDSYKLSLLFVRFHVTFVTCILSWLKNNVKLWDLEQWCMEIHRQIQHFHRHSPKLDTGGLCSLCLLLFRPQYSLTLLR